MTPFERAYYGPDLTPEKLVKDHGGTFAQARATIDRKRRMQLTRRSQ